MSPFDYTIAFIIFAVVINTVIYGGILLNFALDAHRRDRVPQDVRELRAAHGDARLIGHHGV